MKDYGTVKSTIRPEEIKIDEFSVWVASDIKQVKETAGEDTEFTGFEYGLVQYTKDEYIKMQSVQITELQQAIADLYENVG
jgi:hypothetical protein